MKTALLAFSFIALTACVTGPKVRTDYDRSATFTGFRTYSFASELGTDRAGYSTLVTSHFKRAVGREMEARGYRFSEEKPDLLVNFFASVRNETDVQTTPQVSFGAGFYGYRHGLYSAWPLYRPDITTVKYKVGTASIDVVDATRKQLIWEGVAEGRLTEKALNDPGPAIDNAVHDIFTKYPVASGAARP